jgi:anti-sigma factor RsiW
LKQIWRDWSRRLRGLGRGGSGAVGVETGADGHPTPELLSAYQENRLPPEADGEIQEHFVDCAECPELMLDLDRFTSPEAVKSVESDLSDTWVDTAWWRLSSRLRREATPIRWPWLRSSALAWSLTVLLIPWAGSLWLRVDALANEVRAFEAPQLNPPSWNVEPTQVLRGGEMPPPDFEVPAGARQFLLVFTPSGMPADGEYHLRIRSWQGEDLWSERGLWKSAEGTFVVTVPRRFLPAGSYRFRVTGISGNGGEPFEEEFPLRLTYL